MEWFFNPQIDYRFSALGKVQGEDYTIREHALGNKLFECFLLGKLKRKPIFSVFRHFE